MKQKLTSTISIHLEISSVAISILTWKASMSFSALKTNCAG